MYNVQRRSWLLLMLIVVLVLAACGAPGTQTDEPPATTPEAPAEPTDSPEAPAEPTDSPEASDGFGMLMASDQPRETAPDIAPTTLEELVAGNTTFAFDLYQQLRDQEGNLFYSPYSISIALAMTYAGARGETAQQMADALHFTLPQEQLHPAFNALDLELAARGAEEENTDARFQLNIANSIWGQEGYPFEPEYLDVLAQNYGAGLRLTDFAADPDAARTLINDWVANETEQKIEDLLPEGVIDQLTRLVLANAIYFNAGWLNPFEEQNTADGEFTLRDGSSITVPLMAQQDMFRYAEGTGYQAIELPYTGGISMLVILPELEQFDTFEAGLDAAQLQAITGELDRREVVLRMPRFEYESPSVSLADLLRNQGMTAAFEPGVADLSGIDGTEELYIQDVIHKAAVSVDEQGTEAAAATGVAVGVTSAPMDPPVEMTIDSPFVFLIRDNATGTILFVGRVVNPA